MGRGRRRVAFLLLVFTTRDGLKEEDGLAVFVGVGSVAPHVAAALSS